MTIQKNLLTLAKKLMRYFLQGFLIIVLTFSMKGQTSIDQISYFLSKGEELRHKNIDSAGFYALKANELIQSLRIEKHDSANLNKLSNRYLFLQSAVNLYVGNNIIAEMYIDSLNSIYSDSLSSFSKVQVFNLYGELNKEKIRAGNKGSAIDIIFLSEKAKHYYDSALRSLSSSVNEDESYYYRAMLLNNIGELAVLEFKNLNDSTDEKLRIAEKYFLDGLATISTIDSTKKILRIRGWLNFNLAVLYDEKIKIYGDKDTSNAILFEKYWKESKRIRELQIEDFQHEWMLQRLYGVVSFKYREDSKSWTELLESLQPHRSNTYSSQPLSRPYLYSILKDYANLNTDNLLSIRKSITENKLLSGLLIFSIILLLALISALYFALKQTNQLNMLNTYSESLIETGNKLRSEGSLDNFFPIIYKALKKIEIDVYTFGIGLLNEKKDEINFPYAVQNEKKYQEYTRTKKDKNQFSFKTLETKSEIVINDLGLEYKNYGFEKMPVTGGRKLITGELSKKAQSLIYVPVFDNDNDPVGIITVQSPEKNAYQTEQVNYLQGVAEILGMAIKKAVFQNDLIEARIRKEIILDALSHSILPRLQASYNFSKTNNVFLEKAEENDFFSKRQLFEPVVKEMPIFESAILSSLRFSKNVDEWSSKSNFSKIPLRKERFDLNEIGKFIIPFLGNTTSNINFYFNIEPKKYFVYADKMLIKVVFENLITNAFKFTEAGHIKVSVKSNKKTNKLQVLVSDTGIGLIKKDIPKLFDEKVDRMSIGIGNRNKGKGFGLILCKKIIKSHKCMIKATSIYGEGTQIIFTLPKSKLLR